MGYDASGEKLLLKSLKIQHPYNIKDRLADIGVKLFDSRVEVLKAIKKI